MGLGGIFDAGAVLYSNISKSQKIRDFDNEKVDPPPSSTPRHAISHPIEKMGWGGKEKGDRKGPHPPVRTSITYFAVDSTGCMMVAAQL